MDSGVNQVPLVEVNPSDEESEKTQTSTRKDELSIWLKEKLVPHFHKTLEGVTSPINRYIQGDWIVELLEEKLESNMSSSEIFWIIYDQVSCVFSSHTLLQLSNELWKYLNLFANLWPAFLPEARLSELLCMQMK